MTSPNDYLTGTTQLGSFYLTNPAASPSTLNPFFFGESNGYGYTGPVSAIFNSATGNNASHYIAIVTLDDNGSIISVNVQQGLSPSVYGSGYKPGDKVSFSGGSGSGGDGIVTGVDANGAITSITLAPSGIINKLLFAITGASNPPVYFTSAGSTFAANGVVGAFSTEVSGYYNNAIALEINLEDLTQALNLISAASSDYAGVSTPMGTPSGRTSLVWYTSNTNGEYTSTVLDQSISIFNFLKNYAGITLNTSVGGTSEQQVNIQAINAGISPVQNNLQTQQSFLNSAVSTLQTQISQFSQVINQYFSAIQGAANAIG